MSTPTRHLTPGHLSPGAREPEVAQGPTCQDFQRNADAAAATVYVPVTNPDGTPGAPVPLLALGDA